MSIYALSNGGIFNDLERPRTHISRSHHSLTLSVSVTAKSIRPLMWNANRKLCPSFRMLQFRMTLSDLEWLSEIFRWHEPSRGLSATGELFAMLSFIFFQIYLIERYITARVPERFNFTFLCFFSLIVYVLLFHRCSCPAAGRSLTVSPCCSCICICNTVPVKGLIYSRIYAHVVLVDGPKWHIRHSCCSWLDSRYCCYF